ncbi:putative Transcriptional regulator, GntR family [Vibrio nigripulchritudo SOn1]|uniref:Transcriptional regulator, GntR family n=2 Tax=Vibrio nigripulchritudo TaxID=28173 RepID=A0AAV2VYY1_9VIBR|nr:putative Transcriptional regulator, GntR family [Vibrio nigripulchritudo SOn1]
MRTENGMHIDSYKSIEASSVSEAVAKYILEQIQTGNFAAGERLPTEREISNALEVSRPSVREALRGLAILGVVQSKQGGGAYVSSLDAFELLSPLQFYMTLEKLSVDQLYDARVVIECGIVESASVLIQESDLIRLNELIQEQCEATDDPSLFRKLDTEFHRVIANASGNPFMQRMSESLNVLGMGYRKMASETPNLILRSIEDHKLIVEALTLRNAEMAKSAMRLHMEHVRISTRESVANE